MAARRTADTDCPADAAAKKLELLDKLVDAATDTGEGVSLISLDEAIATLGGSKRQALARKKLLSAKWGLPIFLADAPQRTQNQQQRHSSYIALRTEASYLQLLQQYHTTIG